MEASTPSAPSSHEADPAPIVVPGSPQAKRNSRIVALSVVGLGLAVAGLLIWNAATRGPQLPDQDPTVTTATTVATTGG